jgi:hypothetical protein
MSFFAPRSLIIWPFASSTILLSGYSIIVLFSMLSNLVKTFYLLSSIIKNKISLRRTPYFFCVRYSNYHRSHHIHFVRSVHFVRSDISDNERLHTCSEYLLSCRFLPYSTIRLYILDSNRYQLRTFALIAFLLNS